jgi:hypothetical protein
MTDFMNLKIKLTQSFGSVHRDRIRVHVLVSVHTCMSIYICSVFLKKMPASNIDFSMWNRTMHYLLDWLVAGVEEQSFFLVWQAPDALQIYVRQASINGQNQGRATYLAIELTKFTHSRVLYEVAISTLLFKSFLCSVYVVFSSFALCGPYQQWTKTLLLAMLVRAWSKTKFDLSWKKNCDAIGLGWKLSYA